MRVRAWIVAGLLALALPASAGAAPSYREYAVTIDPADYLAAIPDASVLARRLVSQFTANGVNTVYLNAYNVEYGAYYRTTYPYNEESEYGRQDLLGKLLTAAHAEGIRVFAAFYDHQHRGAWEANPGWRAKTASGGDYNPPVTDVQYYLATGNPQAAAWWRGLLRDVLEHYPEVDGFEFREPIINWWGVSADYNDAATRAFRAEYPGAALGGDVWRRFRQQTLTRFLKAEIRLVHDAGRLAHVTTVGDTDASGQMMSPAATARETGFDLDGLLSGPVRPDAVKVELIWQQWARLYGRIAFSPAWTRGAARAFLDDVAGRARVVVHVELTDFGRSRLSVDEFYRTLVAADIPRVAGVDFYSAALADRKRAWPAVRSVYGLHRPAPARGQLGHDHRVLVLYDAAGRVGRARLALTRIERAELLNLLGHYDVKWESRPVEQYRRGELTGFDSVFYLATVYGHAPRVFLSDVSVFSGRVVWIGQSLFQLARSGVRLPFEQSSQRALTAFHSLRYRGRTLPARGEVIATRALPGAVVRASLVAGRTTTPFIVQSRRFWYVAGSPFSFLTGPSSTLNGRYLAFSDLLHAMLGLPHGASRPRALVTIEGVDPLTSPAAIKADAAVLAAARVPFVVSVTPFHVDSARHVEVALQQRPDVVAALRDAVARGGAIVLDGSTHQYKGVTQADAEFWDLKNRGGVHEDSDAYVRGRVRRALDEMWRNGLHPLAWETPQHLATPFDYGVFSDFFSTFVEQRVAGVWRGSAYLQPLPYAVENDVYGSRIFPVNLGSVERPGDVQGAVADARRLSVVRDATAGASVRVGVPQDALARLIRGLRRLRYGFLDLYSAANVVEAPGRVELTRSGVASLPVRSGWYLQRRVLDRAGSVVHASVVAYPSYARPQLRFPEGVRRGLLSVRVLTPRQGASILPIPAADSPPDVRLGEPFTDTFLVRTLVAVALLGVALLAGAYLTLRAMSRRSA